MVPFLDAGGSVALLNRRSVVAFTLALSTGAAVMTAVSAQTPVPAPAPPAQQTPAPVPPDRQALNAAMALTDMSARVTALEKVRTDFPTSTQLATVDQQIFTTLVNNFGDRTTEINAVLDRILARIPDSASPDARLSQTLTPVTMLISKKVLLDRAEKLLVPSVSALDFDKYATMRRDAAKRVNQPEPTQQVLETGFNGIKARGLEQLGRLYLAKGDATTGEAKLCEAVAMSPTLTSAALALVDHYKTTDPTKAENVLKDTIKAAPAFSRAYVELAKLEVARGDEKAALDHYLAGSLGGGVRGADDKAMRDLYTKVRGASANIDDELDTMYREKFPNPVKPEAWTASPKRSNRVVLLEMFTGSGCPPCVSADLAMDAAMERYPEKDVIAVAYHENIPQPDPMVVEAGDARRQYYKISGVPTFNIDGGLGQLGGGARENTPNTYNTYVKKIDAALETPATAALAVKAVAEGEKVNVTVDVTKVPSDAKDMRLHILLVEQELRFTGENGIRFHPVVVRAMAGDKGAGIPITATGKTTHTFDLASVRADVEKTLTAEMEKRRSREAPGSTPTVYSADGRPYTTINPNELSVVAFIQDGPYVAPPPAAPVAAGQPRPEPPPAPTNVLQAAKADVVFAGATKGGR
jgi:thiol-disulfide isomerase/thioredoxin